MLIYCTCATSRLVTTHKHIGPLDGGLAEGLFKSGLLLLDGWTLSCLILVIARKERPSGDVLLSRHSLHGLR